MSKKTKKVDPIIEQASDIVAKAVEKAAKRIKKTKAAEAPVVTAAAQEPPPQIISDPEAAAPKLLALSEDERLRLRLYESEAARYGMEAQVRQARKAAYLRQIDPKGELAKMDTEMRGFAERSTMARKQYIDVVKAVEGRLNIKLENYSFDDDTGALIPH